MDADAFSLFKKNGIFDRATVDSFRKNILEKGGTAHRSSDGIVQSFLRTRAFCRAIARAGRIAYSFLPKKPALNLEIIENEQICGFA